MHHVDQGHQSLVVVLAGFAVLMEAALIGPAVDRSSLRLAYLVHLEKMLIGVAQRIRRRIGLHSLNQSCHARAQISLAKVDRLP